MLKFFLVFFASTTVFAGVPFESLYLCITDQNKQPAKRCFNDVMDVNLEVIDSGGTAFVYFDNYTSGRKNVYQLGDLQTSKNTAEIKLKTLGTGLLLEGFVDFAKGTFQLHWVENSVDYQLNYEGKPSSLSELYREDQRTVQGFVELPSSHEVETQKGAAALRVEQLQGVLNNKKAGLQELYRRYLRLNGETHGVIKLEVAINPIGMVKGVKIVHSEVTDSKLQEEVRQSIVDWMFPESEGETIVHIPLKFIALEK